MAINLYNGAGGVDTWPSPPVATASRVYTWVGIQRV